MKSTSTTHLRHVTPSVFRGIYTVIFTILIGTPTFAQVEKKDTSDFNKWEVGLDLKPLFRKDEQYIIFGKRYLSPKKAVRVGLGLLKYSKGNLDDKEVVETLGKMFETSSPIQYSQNIDNGTEKRNSFLVIVGYQYYLSKKRVSLYTAADLSFFRMKNKYDFTNRGSSILTSSDKTFEGYDPSWLLDEYQNTYSFRGILGVNYSFNRNLSISSEAAMIFEYKEYQLSRIDKPYPNQTYEKYFGNLSKVFECTFNPFIGLFLNYHF